VSVALITDREIQTLNRKFRRLDKVTDVLSFPVQPILPVQPHQPFLGEIAIARGVARRQARSAGHSEATEWRVLALHGLLHLLGYDHEQDDGRMQRVERKLRRKGGLREGLIDRSR
jgi:probable rRNA maturation factor